MDGNPILKNDPAGDYSKFSAWWRSGFGLRGEIYQSGKDGNKEVWGFNVNGVSHFGGDARNNYTDAPTIKPREDNWAGTIKKKYANNWLGGIAYSGFDEVYISIFQIGKERKNLEGFGVDRDAIRDAGINTLVNSIPFSIGLKGLSAAQFSKAFKGTFIPKLNPKLRGVINKRLNTHILKEYPGFMIDAQTLISSQDNTTEIKNSRDK